MAKIAFICTVLVACVATTVFGKVIITRADVETNKDYVTSSIVVKNKTDGTFVDVNVDMHRSIDGKVQLSMEMFKKIGGKYRSLVVTTVRNVCDVLAMRSEMPAIGMVSSMLAQFGSVPKKCPIEAGKFGVKDFKIPEMFISPFVTGGEYQMIYTAEDHNVQPPILVSTTTVEVTMVKDANSNPDNVLKLMKMLAN